MLSIVTLWLPILLSAVLVFFASFIIHMMLPYHRTDVKKLKDEDAVMDALRKFEIPAGDYMFPCGTGPESMKDPAFIEKMKKGPKAIMTVLPAGPPAMTNELIQWFLYCVLVSVFAAYIASRAVGPDAHYLRVFRFAGATAFFCYVVALWQDSIWYKRAWSTTFKNSFDGLVYGLLTAGTFGWLWPR